MNVKDSFMKESYDAFALRYDEMSPLERALNKYQRQADVYFKKLNRIENSPPDVRDKRKHELNEIKRNLALEFSLVENLGDVQSGLEAYRKEGRKLAKDKQGRTLLSTEGHHPTNDLEKNMRAIPVPKPSPDNTAHHIVPGKGKTKFANRARVRLHLFGIRINDPDNGVWLPMYARHTPHWSMPESKGHLQYHTHGYEKWVHKQIQSRSSEANIRQELKLVGTMLKQNNLPPEAGKK